MEKKYKILIALFFFALAFYFLWLSKKAAVPGRYAEFRNIKINGADIQVEIADTPEKQEKGLSGRDSLPEGQGMLFVFPKSDHYSFWMKDMKFGLDFVWIEGDKVVEITPRVRPEDYQPPKAMISGEKVDKVLEISAGMAEKLSVKVGDSVGF